MKPTCKDCKFFHKHDEFNAACRKNPPVFYVWQEGANNYGNTYPVESASGWPSVDKDGKDWCGSFEGGKKL